MSIGVNVLDGGYPSRSFDGRLAYHWGTFYPDLETWGAVTRQRLMDWGFNTVGAWSLGPSTFALPFIPDLELGRTVALPLVRSLSSDYGRGHARYGPPPGSALQRQSVPHWRVFPPITKSAGGYSALFTYYLQQPATNYTKQKLLALLQEQYDNNWARFGHDFVPPTGVARRLRLSCRAQPGPTCGLVARAFR